MPCPYNCQTCNAVSTCTTCATGFYSDPVLGCLMCSYQCLTCLSKNQIMKCSSCATGTYLNTVSYTCTNCPSGALACSSPTVISQCLVGYYKTSNSMFCLPCPSNCLSCPSSNVLCTSCNKGYYLLSSNCSPCTIVNCVACAYLSSSQVCSQCSTGYRLVSGSCSACSSNCLSCSSASTCTLCAKNYYLSGSSCAPVTTTVANCQTSSTATSCASCQVGYYLSNNKCYSCSILCTQCWGDHFGACTACTANSNLFNSMCLINNYLDSKTYQYLYSFPGQSALVTQGTPDCNKLLITGTSISLQANNLAGSQIIIYWKIFSLSPAAAYTVTLSNSKGTASSPFSTTTSPSFSYCTSNPSRQYTLGMSNSTFSSILLTNSITFSSSVQLSLQ